MLKKISYILFLIILVSGLSFGSASLVNEFYVNSNQNNDNVIGVHSINNNNNFKNFVFKHLSDLLGNNNKANKVNNVNDENDDVIGNHYKNETIPYPILPSNVGSNIYISEKELNNINGTNYEENFEKVAEYFKKEGLIVNNVTDPNGEKFLKIEVNKEIIKKDQLDKIAYVNEDGSVAYVIIDIDINFYKQSTDIDFKFNTDLDKVEDGSKITGSVVSSDYWEGDDYVSDPKEVAIKDIYINVIGTESKTKNHNTNYVPKTDENGNFNTVYKNEYGGNYSITAKINDDDVRYNGSIIKDIHSKSSTEILSLNNESVKGYYVNENISDVFKFELKDKYGVSLANKDVSVNINGIELDLTSNSDGIINVPMKVTEFGDYNSKVVFNGDINNTKSDKSSSLFIKMYAGFNKKVRFEGSPGMGVQTWTQNGFEFTRNVPIALGYEGGYHLEFYDIYNNKISGYGVKDDHDYVAVTESDEYEVPDKAVTMKVKAWGMWCVPDPVEKIVPAGDAWFLFYNFAPGAGQHDHGYFGIRDAKGRLNGYKVDLAKNGKFELAWDGEKQIPGYT
jgi:hypothetical protein